MGNCCKPYSETVIDSYRIEWKLNRNDSKISQLNVKREVRQLFSLQEVTSININIKLRHDIEGRGFKKYKCIYCYSCKNDSDLDEDSEVVTVANRSLIMRWCDKINRLPADTPDKTEVLHVLHALMTLNTRISNQPHRIQVDL